MIGSKMSVDKQSKCIDSGIFCISLDVELFWGVLDKRTIDSYRTHLTHTPLVIKEMLAMFNSYDIHVTWAIVGFLFYSNFLELKRGLPSQTPSYVNSRLSSYAYIESKTDLEGRFHFLSDII